MSTGAGVMNGPGGMYKSEPYYNNHAKVDLPDCMYKVKSYYTDENRDSKLDNNVAAQLTTLERRQEAILKRLAELKAEVNELAGNTTSLQAFSNGSSKIEKLTDVVISADPHSPPLSLFVLYSLLQEQYKVLGACHTHSSVLGLAPPKLTKVFNGNGLDRDRCNYQLILTLLWKDVKHGAALMVSPQSQITIEGEANVGRYLARLLNPSYDEGDIARASEIDSVIDLATKLMRCKEKEKASIVKTFNVRLGKSSWLVGNTMSLADIVCWSAMYQSKQASNAAGNIKKWLQTCNQHPAFQFALKLV